MEDSVAVDPHKIYLSFVDKHCLGKTHVKGFNEFITCSIYQNIYGSTIHFGRDHTISFENLVIREPCYVHHQKVNRLTPAYAKKQLLTYASDMLVDVIVRRKEGTVAYTKTGIHIGSIPIMVKSAKCNLNKLTSRQLVACGEDPTDPGGYFLIKGLEYVVMYWEKLDLNKFILFTNKKEKNDVDVTITTLNESRKTSKQVVYYCYRNKMVMVFLPSLNTQGASRLQSSVNILHIIKILVCSLNLWLSTSSLPTHCYTRSS